MPTCRKFAVNLAAFFAGMSAICTLIAYAGPANDIPQITAKLNHLASNSQVIDTIFFGSSHIRRQISPEIFDQEMRDANRPTTSVNYGIDALASPELLKVFNELMDRKPRTVRTIFVDLKPLRKVIASEGTQSRRELWWRDFKHTWLVLRSINLNTEPPRAGEDGKLSLAASHLLLMLQNLTHIGILSDSIHDAIFPTPKVRDGELDRRGFHPEAQSLSPTMAKAFRDEMSGMMAKPRFQLVDPTMDDVCREMSARCESEGVRLVFIMMPTVGSRRSPLPPADVLQRHLLLTFDEPEKYPALYMPEERYDLQHFNKTGAAVFTRELARAFSTQARSLPGWN